MAFTSKDVMDLRQRTGVGMMDCKKALVETDGDMDKAIEYLREKGIAKAAKKSGRVTAEGVVACAAKGNAAALVEVNCETDFVARGDQFKALVSEIADVILSKNPKDVEALLQQKHGKETISEMVTGAIAKIGENISVRRFVKYEIKNGVVDTYIHLGGKVGVVVESETDAKGEKVKTLIHDVALQIAAMKPEFISSEEVSSDKIAKEKEILFAQAKTENPTKPDAVIEKMVEGRIKKFYEENCLLDQKFFKDPTMTIAKLIDSVAKEVGAKIVIKKFTRYELGEGLEKRENDFANEINEQIEKMKTNK